MPVNRAYNSIPVEIYIPRKLFEDLRELAERCGLEPGTWAGQVVENAIAERRLEELPKPQTEFGRYRKARQHIPLPHIQLTERQQETYRKLLGIE